MKARKHHLVPFHFGWLFCATCGLVALRNTATTLALRRPCPGEVDE